jgi:hypothetical protein
VEFEQTLIATVVGVAFGFLGSYLISWRERSRALHDQLRRAIAAYIADMTTAVARLRELPPAVEPGPLDRALDQLRGEQASWAATQRGLLETLGPEWRTPIEDVIRSGAELRTFQLPGEMTRAMDHADQYMLALMKDRTPALHAEWSEIHAELAGASKETLARALRWGSRRGS